MIWIAMRLRRMSRAVALGAALLVCACASDEEPIPGESTPADRAVEQDTEPRVAAVGAWAHSRAASEPLEEAQNSTGFPHAPHVDVACNTCHGRLAGHATHTSVDCAECHGQRPSRSPAPAREVLGEETCLTCHHASDSGMGCTRCHAPNEAGPLAVTQRFDVAGTISDRSAYFRHRFHESPRCATCHQDPVSRAVERECSSCHEEHHRPAADCRQCHSPSTLKAHDTSVHGGCAVSGCHDAEAIAELSRLGAIGPTAPRTGCLVCHQGQQEHEQGAACASCHFPGREGPGALVDLERGGRP